MPDDDRGEAAVADQSRMDALLNQGVDHHQAGRWKEAVACYRDALVIDAENLLVNSNLGAVLTRVGEFDEAIAACNRALAIDPEHVGARNNLGTALQRAGRTDEAVDAYLRALELNPRHVGAARNLGTALRALSRLDQAVAFYQQAIDADPNVVEIHCLLGDVLRELGRQDEALAAYRGALELTPDSAAIHYGIGSALQQKDMNREAAAAFRRALKLKPDHVHALNDLGNVLYAMSEPDNAVACFRRAIEFNPRYAGAYNNLGHALQDLGRLDAAVASYRRAVELSPRMAESYSSLGNALKDLGRFDGAFKSYDQALEVRPDYAGAHFNRGVALLTLGRLAEGWPEYEWRRRRKELKGSIREFSETVWDGGRFDGKTLLLHTEQGLGDTIQFVRYAKTVAELGGRVVLECNAKLVRLLRGVEGLDAVIGRDEALPDFDLHAPLMSLPMILGTEVATIPAPTRYIGAEADAVADWRERLSGLPRPLVALCWQGSMTYRMDRWRSLPLSVLSPLAEIDGVSFVSVQKGAGERQIGEVDFAGRLTAFGDDLDGGDDAFIDTSAIMECADLVITSDTSVAHLAGALGRPTWLMLGVVPDWRWLLDRPDTPWYPAMRLFRQQARGDWRPVVAAIGDGLTALAARSRTAPGPD